MLLYDHSRTENIIDRLTKSERFVRFVGTIFCIAFLSLIGMWAGASMGDRAAMVLAGIIGALVGLAVGRTLALIYSVVVEWMCQMLIAEGEIIAASKQKRKE